MVIADIEVSPFLYIPYRPGVSVGGSVLVILAQSGYTREAILCVPTCRTTSLIGKDSNGGLVELWDVLGKRKGRLTSICRIGNTTRVKALLRDHLVINTTDLAIALRTAAFFYQSLNFLLQILVQLIYTSMELLQYNLQLEMVMQKLLNFFFLKE
jgi:hypothetical protein